MIQGLRSICILFGYVLKINHRYTVPFGPRLRHGPFPNKPLFWRLSRELHFERPNRRPTSLGAQSPTGLVMSALFCLASYLPHKKKTIQKRAQSCQIYRCRTILPEGLSAYHPLLQLLSSAAKRQSLGIGKNDSRARQKLGRCSYSRHYAANSEIIFYCHPDGQNPSFNTSQDWLSNTF